MEVLMVTDGKHCEDICRYAPPEKKWPCVDCDIRYHDRAEPKEPSKKKRYRQRLA